MRRLATNNQIKVAMRRMREMSAAMYGSVSMALTTVLCSWALESSADACEKRERMTTRSTMNLFM